MNRESEQYRFARIEGYLITLDRLEKQFEDTAVNPEEMEAGRGRSDDLKPITIDLLIDLQEKADLSIFSRIRIAVIDLDSEADRVSATLSLLSQIVPKGRSMTAKELPWETRPFVKKGRRPG